MNKIRGAALLVHGGGPTQVINASLAGVADECRRHSEITSLYGARFGIEGVLAGDFVECGTNTGIMSLAICKYIDFNNTGKRFFLFDTYCGIPEEQILPEERHARNILTTRPAAHYCRREYPTPGSRTEAHRRW